MVVEIDDKSGFCFGVVNAINKAEEALKSGKTVYSLGDIVHNKVEMRRLERLGLKSISNENISSLANQTVFVRAHGEPPSTYEKAKENNITIIDATCPVVANLQIKVKKAYEQMEKIGGQVVILGKRGHAEVVGLNGQIDNKAIVIESIEDLHCLVDFSRPLHLLSQTTKSLTLFEQVKQDIYANTPEGADLGHVTISDTICRQVSNRNPHLKEFAQKFDVILFVSGKESSNGHSLYQICKQANQRSYKIEDEAEIEMVWLDGVQSIGICGATSTPRWLMEQVAEFVRTRCK